MYVPSSSVICLQRLSFALSPLIYLCNLAVFILNNYRQALKIIRENSATLEQELHRLGLDRAAVEGWITEELQYLSNKEAGETLEISLKCSYVQELKKLAAAE